MSEDMEIEVEFEDELEEWIRANAPFVMPLGGIMVEVSIDEDGGFRLSIAQEASDE